MMKLGSFVLKLKLATSILLLSFALMVSSFANAQQGDPAYPNILLPGESSHGEIAWLAGYYDTPTQTISGKIRFDINRRKWVYDGRWGRIEDGRVVEKGDVFLVFEDKQESQYNCPERGNGECWHSMVDRSTFSGHMTSDAGGDRLPWTGSVGVNFGFRAANPNQMISTKYKYSDEGTPYQGPNSEVSTYNLDLHRQIGVLRAKTRWNPDYLRRFESLSSDVTAHPKPKVRIRQEFRDLRPVEISDPAKYVEGVVLAGGTFLLRRNGQVWDEHEVDMSKKYTFDFIGKDKTRVKLYDESRDIHLHLNVKDLQATYAYGNSEHKPFGRIEEIVYVRDIGTVGYSSGYFRRADTRSDEWVNVSDDGLTGHRFYKLDFQDRDKIVLFENSGDGRVTLNLKDRSIYASSRQDRRLRRIYNITYIKDGLGR